MNTHEKERYEERERVQPYRKSADKPEILL